MRLSSIQKYGTPDVLALKEISKPMPKGVLRQRFLFIKFVVNTKPRGFTIIGHDKNR